MAYTCDKSEFVYFNKDGKTVASGYNIDCPNLNTRRPIMSTNISSYLGNMGIPVGLVVNKKNNNIVKYELPSNKIADEELYSLLLKNLSTSKQMQYNIKTKCNKKPKCISKPKRKTAKNKSKK